jgi:hypothetical protein
MEVVFVGQSGSQDLNFDKLITPSAVASHLQVARQQGGFQIHTFNAVLLPAGWEAEEFK